ncbi:protein C- splicing region [Neisseria elongata]
MNELNDQCAAENALSSSMGCFMKGTLVETEEGWTPIDELKVGDLVMSRPENGIGEAVPKRVVNTFSYEDREVVMLKFSQFPERSGGGRILIATPNHPFCVYGVVTNLILEHPKFGKLGAYWKGCDYDDGEDVFAGDEGRARYEALWAFKHTPYEMRLYEQPVWKRADQLERGDVVLGLENDYYVVEDYRPLYAYRDTDQAWAQPINLAYGWKESDLGNSYEMVLTDESLNCPTLDWADVPNDENLLYVDEDGQRHYRPYRTTVYNIEVEDYHTYCVSMGGILVHNQNCGAERRSRVDSPVIRDGGQP